MKDNTILDPYQRLGSALEIAIKSSGKTVGAVAGTVGVSENFLSKLIRGQQNPNQLILSRISESVGMKVSQIYRIAESLDLPPVQWAKGFGVRGGTEDLLDYNDPEMLAALHHFIRVKGWKKRELVRRTGIDGNTIDDWFQGRYAPWADGLRVLCNVFGVSRSEFLAVGEALVEWHRLENYILFDHSSRREHSRERSAEQVAGV